MPQAAAASSLWRRWLCLVLLGLLHILGVVQGHIASSLTTFASEITNTLGRVDGDLLEYDDDSLVAEMRQLLQDVTRLQRGGASRRTRKLKAGQTWDMLMCMKGIYTEIKEGLNPYKDSWCVR